MIGSRGLSKKGEGVKARFLRKKEEKLAEKKTVVTQNLIHVTRIPLAHPTIPSQAVTRVTEGNSQAWAVAI